MFLAKQIYRTDISGISMKIGEKYLIPCKLCPVNSCSVTKYQKCVCYDGVNMWTFYTKETWKSFFNFIIYFLLKNTLTKGLQLPNRQTLCYFLRISCKIFRRQCRKYPKLLHSLRKLSLENLWIQYDWGTSRILSINTQKDIVFIPVLRKHNIAKKREWTSSLIVTDSSESPVQTLLACVCQVYRWNITAFDDWTSSQVLTHIKWK